MILFNVNHRDLTCFLGDAIRLIDGCLTEGFAGSLPESWAIPHFHCPGNMMESSSSQAQPIHSKAPGHASFKGCTGFAGCHGLHCLRTALAQVTVIAISKTLFPCFCTPSSLSMFIPYSFSCLTSPPYPFSSTHRLSTLGRTQKPSSKVHLLAQSCRSISTLKDTCNLKYCSCVGTLAAAAPSK